MSKFVKKMMIDEMRERIGDASELLVINSSRLDVISDNKFRTELGKKEISVLTVKNTLARRALNESGITALDTVLDGPSALVWGGEDIVALSKEIASWAKQLDGLEIKGGTVEGSTLSSSDVDALSKSPSREELIAKIVMLALSPGSQLVGALLGPGGTVAGQVKSIEEGAENTETETEEVG